MVRYPNIYDRNLSKGFQEILYYINDTTDSWISNMLLIGIFIIVSFNVFNHRDDLWEAFAIGGFTTFLISTLFWIGGFISGVTVTITLATAILGFVTLIFSKRR